MKKNKHLGCRCGASENYNYGGRGRVIELNIKIRNSKRQQLHAVHRVHERDELDPFIPCPKRFQTLHLPTPIFPLYSTRRLIFHPRNRFTERNPASRLIQSQNQKEVSHSTSGNPPITPKRSTIEWKRGDSWCNWFEGWGTDVAKVLAMGGIRNGANIRLKAQSEYEITMNKL